MFEKLTLIGIGLIGSSIARAVKLKGLAKTIAITTRKSETLEEARSLGLGDIYTLDAAEAVEGADLVILCTPVGVYADVMSQIRDHLAPGAILSDVGSVKEYVSKQMAAKTPAGVHLIPGHPLAGTEHSGPAAGVSTHQRPTNRSGKPADGPECSVPAIGWPGMKCTPAGTIGSSAFITWPFTEPTSERMAPGERCPLICFIRSA